MSQPSSRVDVKTCALFERLASLATDCGLRSLRSPQLDTFSRFRGSPQIEHARSPRSEIHDHKSGCARSIFESFPWALAKILRQIRTAGKLSGVRTVFVAESRMLRECACSRPEERRSFLPRLSAGHNHSASELEHPGPLFEPALIEKDSKKYECSF